MADSSIITVRVSPALKEQVDAIAESMDRPRSWLVEKAIEEFVEVQKWHIADMEAAIREADEGKFASPAEVAARFRVIRRRLADKKRVAAKRK